MAESEEKLKNLLMKVKDKDTKADFKLNIKKPRLCHLVSSLHGKIEGGKVEVLTDFIFLVSKITADGDCSHEIKKCMLIGQKAITNIDSILTKKQRHHFADKGL